MPKREQILDYLIHMRRCLSTPVGCPIVHPFQYLKQFYSQCSNSYTSKYTAETSKDQVSGPKISSSVSRSSLAWARFRWLPVRCPRVKMPGNILGSVPER